MGPNDVIPNDATSLSQGIIFTCYSLALLTSILGLYVMTNDDTMTWLGHDGGDHDFILGLLKVVFICIYPLFLY